MTLSEQIGKNVKRAAVYTSWDIYGETVSSFHIGNACRVDKGPRKVTCTVGSFAGRCK